MFLSVEVIDGDDARDSECIEELIDGSLCRLEFHSGSRSAPVEVDPRRCTVARDCCVLLDADGAPFRVQELLNDKEAEPRPLPFPSLSRRLEEC